MWLFLLLAASAVTWPQTTARNPAITIAVWYDVRDPTAFPTDLATIRRSGFNGVVTPLSAADGALFEKLTAVAGSEGLAVETAKDVTVAAEGPERAVIGSGEGEMSARMARLSLWSAIATGRRRFVIIDESPRRALAMQLGESAGVVTRNLALFAPLQPRPFKSGQFRLEPRSPVTVHRLESDSAIVLVALNHSATTRRVKITFPPDTPEAIWQNMEAGVAVNFVTTAAGPEFEHTFAPYDAVVLAIRKTLR